MNVNGRLQQNMEKCSSDIKTSPLRMDSSDREINQLKTCRLVPDNFLNLASRSVKAKNPVYRIKRRRGGNEILSLHIAPLTGTELHLKETSPMQATDLDGPSSLITNSVFSKGFGLLPYAFCNLPRTRQVPIYRYPQFSNEASRLRTFRQNWCHGLDPGQLAASGFFNAGSNDLVRCFWCGVGFKDWTPTDNPWYQHIKLSRDCGFPESALNPDDLHAYKEQIRAEQTTSQQVLMGTQDGRSPSHYPNYAPVDVRVSSFNKWPKVTPTAWALAEAGLFYTGVNDSVRCFHCNGGMRNWDDGDDPWMEHARWFPSCGFVRQQKGDEYIRLVQLASDAEDGAAAQSPEIVRALQTMTLNEPMGDVPKKESENPIYTPAAQAVIDMGFSRAAVSMAIEECNREGKRWNAEILSNILFDKQDRGEPLPVDSHNQNPKVESRIKMDTPESVDELIVQNDILRRQLTCCICDENEADILFLPCGHVRICEKCSSDVTMCMFCVTPITEKIKTYK